MSNRWRPPPPVTLSPVDAAAAVLLQLHQGRLGYRSFALRPSPAALREAARQAGAFSSTGQPLLLELQRPPSPLRFCTPLRSPDWEYTFAAAAPTIGDERLNVPPPPRQQLPREGPADESNVSERENEEMQGEPPLVYLRKIRW